MKKSRLNAVIILTCSLALGEGVRAQDVSKIAANVPYEFVAGAATLPAGTCVVGVVSAGAPLGLGSPEERSSHFGFPWN